MDTLHQVPLVSKIPRAVWSLLLTFKFREHIILLSELESNIQVHKTAPDFIILEL